MASDIKIKDLLIKLQVLANGLVEERKKTQSYLNKIKEFEETLQKKETEIVDLNKEKQDLKTRLTLEKAKQNQPKEETFLDNIASKINPNSIGENEEKYKSLKETYNQQKFELKDLNQRLKEEMEQYDQQNMKLHTLTGIQEVELEKLNQQISQLSNDQTNLDLQKKDVAQTIKLFEQEKINYDEKISNIQKENVELNNKIAELDQKINNYSKKNEDKTKEINAQKKKVKDFESDLKEMEKKLNRKELKNIVFTVERLTEGMIHKSKPMTMTFQKREEKKNNSQIKEIYECIIDRKKDGKEIQQKVNFVDFVRFERNDKNPLRIEIEFNIEGQTDSVSIQVHELLIDYFIETYYDYYQRAQEVYKSL